MDNWLLPGALSGTLLWSDLRRKIQLHFPKTLTIHFALNRHYHRNWVEFFFFFFVKYNNALRSLRCADTIPAL